jgi:organic radical activating enzyme
MTVDEIADKIADPRLTVITGGEPAMHDLGPLVQRLHKNNKYVALETNGTKVIPDTWNLDWVTASPKPLSNYKLLCKADELKYVVDDAFDVYKINRQAVPAGRIFLQVESGRVESAQKAYNIILKHPEMELRLGIQLHKVIHVQ